MSRTCGFRLGCRNEGAVQIVAADGGFFGWVCYDCADALERKLESTAAHNARFMAPDDPVADEAEHVLDHLEHMKEGHA